ncbi:hypothetical protein LSAT2_011193, partial [Lamellibrachia satsuma]
DADVDGATSPEPGVLFVIDVPEDEWEIAEPTTISGQRESNYVNNVIQ